VKDEVRLVQTPCPLPLSAFVPVDVCVYRHDFVSVFRLDAAVALHPADFALLEGIDAAQLRHEADSETVFLARAAMERLRLLSAPSDPRAKMLSAAALAQKRARYAALPRYSPPRRW